MKSKKMLAPREKTIITSPDWLSGRFDRDAKFGVFLESPEHWDAIKRSLDAYESFLSLGSFTQFRPKKRLQSLLAKMIVARQFNAQHQFGVSILEFADIAKPRGEIVDFATARGLTIDIDEDSENGSAATEKYQPSPDRFLLPPYTPTHEDAQEIREILSQIIPEIRIPKTETLDEFAQNPVFPVFAKMESLGDGFGKIFIETPEDFARFLRFLQTPGAGGLADEFSMQRFIPTPTEHATSYRLAMSAAGDILYSTLRYTTVDEFPPAPLGTSDSRLAPIYDKNSEFFFGKDPKVLSTTGWGGGQISLDPLPCSKKLSEKDRAILRAHGLDAENPEIPEILRAQGEKIGIFMGGFFSSPFTIADFVQDAKTGDFYFLEAHYTQSCDGFSERYEDIEQIKTNDGETFLAPKYQIMAALGSIANCGVQPDFQARRISRVGCAILNGFLPSDLCDKTCVLKDLKEQKD